MALSDDVGRIAAAAAAYAGPREQVAAVLPVEVGSGERLYLCAFAVVEGGESWLVLDDRASPVTSRRRVRDAASIAALVEVAEDTAGAASVGEARLASLSYLDSIGGAALDGGLAGAIQSAIPAVEELAKGVEANYKLVLT